MQQISRDKLDRLLRANPEFTFCAFDRYGLRDQLPARPTLTPEIRFLYIGSSICSTLPSDPASRRRPCASLSLHLYQVVKRTFTSKLSNMHGVQHKDEPLGSSSGFSGYAYPRTFTVEKANTTWPLAGAPKARAGSNVVKISALSIFTRSVSESCPERMR